MSSKSAKESLELIEEDLYNLDRKDSLIIKDLIEIIKYLDKRIKYLEESNEPDEDEEIIRRGVIDETQS